jgi:hypothetical protein
MVTPQLNGVAKADFSVVPQATIVRQDQLA